MGLISWFKNKFDIVSPSIAYAKWVKKFMRNFKKGWDRGHKKSEKALASAPAIGELYWVILWEGDDLYSGEIAVRTWQNDFDDRFLCAFGKLYRSREEALRAKLIMIKEKREKR